MVAAASWPLRREASASEVALRVRRSRCSSEICRSRSATSARVRSSSARRLSRSAAAAPAAVASRGARGGSPAGARGRFGLAPPRDQLGQGLRHQQVHGQPLAQPGVLLHDRLAQDRLQAGQASARAGQLVVLQPLQGLGQGGADAVAHQALLVARVGHLLQAQAGAKLAHLRGQGSLALRLQGAQAGLHFGDGQAAGVEPLPFGFQLGVHGPAQVLFPLPQALRQAQLAGAQPLLGFLCLGLLLLQAALRLPPEHLQEAALRGLEARAGQGHGALLPAEHVAQAEEAQGHDHGGRRVDQDRVQDAFLAGFDGQLGGGRGPAAFGHDLVDLAQDAGAHLGGDLHLLLQHVSRFRATGLAALPAGSFGSIRDGLYPPSCAMDKQPALCQTAGREHPGQDHPDRPAPAGGHPGADQHRLLLLRPQRHHARGRALPGLQGPEPAQLPGQPVGPAVRPGPAGPARVPGGGPPGRRLLRPHPAGEPLRAHPGPGPLRPGGAVHRGAGPARRGGRAPAGGAAPPRGGLGGAGDGRGAPGGLRLRLRAPGLALLDQREPRRVLPGHHRHADPQRGDHGPGLRGLPGPAAGVRPLPDPAPDAAWWRPCGGSSPSTT